MKIIAIATARNEADVIEAFVRHTLSYCDALIVMDHWSTDATPFILQNLKAEGLPLVLLHDATPGHLQVKHMTAMLDQAVNEHGADWVICLDADEFLQGPGLETLRSLPAGGEFLKIPHYSYIAQPSDDLASVNPVERIVHTIERPAREWFHYKMIVPAALARQSGALVRKGSHILEIGNIEAPSRILPDAWINHFSLRSPGQYASKLVARVLQISLDRNPHRGHARYYESPYQSLFQSYRRFCSQFYDTRLSWDNMEGATATLTKRPTDYRGAPLRYTTTIDDTDYFISSLMGLTEGILSAQALDAPKDSGGGGEGASVAISLKSPPLPGEAREELWITEGFRQNQSTFSTLCFGFSSPHRHQAPPVHLRSLPRDFTDRKRYPVRERWGAGDLQPQRPSPPVKVQPRSHLSEKAGSPSLFLHHTTLYLPLYLSL